ncbi:MAG: hypothetical protein R3B68_02175 [Phycisphaerales bacterium]
MLRVAGSRMRSRILEEAIVQHAMWAAAHRPGNREHAMGTNGKKSKVGVVFAVIAILCGTLAFLTAGLKGQSAGTVEMLTFCAPAWVAMLVAIAVQRSAMSFVAVGFGALAVAAFFMAGTT